MTAPGEQNNWLRAYARGLTLGLKGWVAQLHKFAQNQTLRHSDERPSAAVTYDQGPMLYIGQQIVKRMAKMGYPSKIQEHWRTPERQKRLKAEGFSKAGPWSSPHQFGEAVDIVHKTLGWNVPEEYWNALAVCVRVIEAELNVSLTHGHTWAFRDSAHVELTDWRTVRDAQLQAPEGARVPTQSELLARWKQVLPGIRIP